MEGLATWERWADDVETVMKAVGSERAAIFGIADSGPSALLFAAAQPDRTRALILGNTTARFSADDDYELGIRENRFAETLRLLGDIWGTEQLAEFGFPDAARDPAFRQWYAKQSRMGCTPREAAIFHHWTQSTDLRDILPSIRVPTLVLHREHFAWITADQGRHLAQHIPGARFEVVPGADGSLYTEPTAEAVGHIEEFLTGTPAASEPDRALASVLFTDMVGSTERAAALGDRRWRDLLESHDTVSRSVVEQHRGRLVKMTGDGILATFEGPGRAIRCAFALRAALGTLGIEVRAGLHTGEVELRGDDIGGIGVHVAARVLDNACAGELLVSPAVPLLVVGSGLRFDDRGERELKGVPGIWRLYAVDG
jgi:class 3 adenylate cyclase